MDGRPLPHPPVRLFLGRRGRFESVTNQKTADGKPYQKTGLDGPINHSPQVWLKERLAKQAQAEGQRQEQKLGEKEKQLAQPASQSEKTLEEIKNAPPEATVPTTPTPEKAKKKPLEKADVGNEPKKEAAPSKKPTSTKANTPGKENQPKEKPAAEGAVPTDKKTPEAPKLDETDGGTLIDSLAAQPPSAFLMGVKQSAKALLRVQKKEKTQLQTSLPVIDPPTGLPAKPKKGKPASAQAGNGTPLSLEGKGAATVPKKSPPL